jgi:hypothetical protein
MVVGGISDFYSSAQEEQRKAVFFRCLFFTLISLVIFFVAIYLEKIDQRTGEILNRIQKRKRESKEQEE